MSGGVPKKSRRGVYYDLTMSPYEIKTPYGDIFKFSSQKKMEIYARDVDKEIKRVDDLINRHNLRAWIPEEVITLLKRAVTKSFYRQVER